MTLQSFKYLFLLLSLIVISGCVKPTDNSILTIDKARLVLEESNIPESLLRDAEGIIIIPQLFKSGLLVAIESGAGILLMRDENNRTQWSDPCFIKFKSGSIGFQAGVQSSDIVLVVRNRRGLAGLVDGAMTLGVGGSIAVGPVGAGALATTDFTAEIYSYSLSKGMFAGISIERGMLSIDQPANANVYGKMVSASDIFTGKVVSQSEVIKQFKAVLVEYSSPKS